MGWKVGTEGPMSLLLYANIRFVITWGTWASVILSQSPEGTGWSSCQATLDDIREVMAVRWIPQWLKKNKSHPLLRRIESMTQGTTNLTSTCWSHYSVRESHLRDPPGSYAKVYGRKEGDIGFQAWFCHGQVVPDQPYGILQWHKYISRQAKTHWCHLSGLQWGFRHGPPQ